MKYISALFILLSLNCCASESGVTIINHSGHTVTVYYKTTEQRRHVEILHDKYAAISMRRPSAEKPESLYFHWKYQPADRQEIVERQEKITLTEPTHRFTLAPAIVIAAEKKKFGLLTDKTYSKSSDDRD